MLSAGYFRGISSQAPLCTIQIAAGGAKSLDIIGPADAETCIFAHVFCSATILLKPGDFMMKMDGPCARIGRRMLRPCSISRSDEHRRKRHRDHGSPNTHCRSFRARMSQPGVG
jgi:hypothetical protein